MLLLNSLAETLSQILGYISVFCWYLMSGCSLVLETQGVEVYNKGTCLMMMTKRFPSSDPSSTHVSKIEI